MSQVQDIGGMAVVSAIIAAAIFFGNRDVDADNLTCTSGNPEACALAEAVYGKYMEVFDASRQDREVSQHYGQGAKVRQVALGSIQEKLEDLRIVATGPGILQVYLRAAPLSDLQEADQRMGVILNTYRTDLATLETDLRDSGAGGLSAAAIR